jgi:hypothetical protein
MFSLISYGIGIALILAFFHLDGPRIVKNTAVVKWGKFRRINRLVSTNYKGCFTILWISCCMVVQAIWVSIIQYMNSTIVKLDKNTYRVTYVIKGKIYMLVVKPTRGPRKVLLVSDETQTDVSGEIFPYLGPEENFHGEIYTPHFFKKKELVFELSDGTEKKFLLDDKINLN